MEQAERGIAGFGSPEKPVVIQRRNNMTTAESLVVMRLEDWAVLYEAYLDSLGIHVRHSLAGFGGTRSGRC